MKFKIINNPKTKKRILIAPLDWGLGHATRCIPIIYELLRLNFELIVAASGLTKILLKKEFPNLFFVDLPGYNIRYATAKNAVPLKLLLQIPKIIRGIYSENRWLKKAVDFYKIDVVVSDNRLGLFHKKITSIYITHQLRIKAKNSLVENLLQKVHYFFINEYQFCWVPDNEGAVNFAGELSHPKKLPKTTLQYLGPLSRFEKFNSEKRFDLLFLISGPEPQRTVLEKIILDQISLVSGKIALIRGIPENKPNKDLEYDNANNIFSANHLEAAKLNMALLQADYIICRSGYTTVMDLAKLGKRAILIPTPGQTEQEYLAKYLEGKGCFLSMNQEKFLITEALNKAKAFPYTFVNENCEQYKIVIKNFAEGLKA